MLDTLTLHNVLLNLQDRHCCDVNSRDTTGISLCERDMRPYHGEHTWLGFCRLLCDSRIFAAL